jgi:hypothetical protein
VETGLWRQQRSGDIFKGVPPYHQPPILTPLLASSSPKDITEHHIKIINMDPVSISVSLLAVITAAIQSANTLKETVTRFKERNKTLGRLQYELEDLTKILDLLQNAIDTDASVLALYKVLLVDAANYAASLKTPSKFSLKSQRQAFEIGQEWNLREEILTSLSRLLRVINLPFQLG